MLGALPRHQVASVRLAAIESVLVSERPGPRVTRIEHTVLQGEQPDHSASDGSGQANGVHSCQ